MSKRSLFSILGIIIVILIAGFLIFFIYVELVEKELKPSDGSSSGNKTKENLERTSAKSEKEMELPEGTLERTSAKSEQEIELLQEILERTSSKNNNK